MLFDLDGTLADSEEPTDLAIGIGWPAMALPTRATAYETRGDLEHIADTIRRQTACDERLTRRRTARQLE